MSVLIGISVMLWLLTWLIQGFNFSTILSFITTIMFCGRKVKYFCKPTTLVTMESIGIFITVVIQLLFHRFNFIETVIIVILRAIFIGIVYYDTEYFVYITIEKRKESKED